MTQQVHAPHGALRGDARFFERPRHLARLLTKQALRAVHRRPLEFFSSALDQLGQLAAGPLVVEAIAPLGGPLPEHGKVVILTDQVGQLVGTSGDSPHLLRLGGADEFAPVPRGLFAAVKRGGASPAWTT